MQPSPEMRFVLACARPPAADDGAAPEAGGLDWDHVLTLALIHAVLPHVQRRLTRLGIALPPAAQAAFTRQQTALAARSALLIQELRRLLALLDEQNVDVLAYKGPTLAAQAYGDAGARQFQDLDLIVRPGQYARARAVLLAAGYRPIAGRAPPERVLRASECDETFTLMRTGVTVELHWAIVPPYFSLPYDVGGLFERRAEVVLGGMRASTTGRTDSILLCAINGAKDGWGRLETVSALSHLAGDCGASDWDALMARAAGMRSQRMLLVGLGLAQQMLGQQLPAGVAVHLATDRAAQALISESIARILREETGRLTIWRRSHYLLRSREALRDRAVFCARRLLTPTTRDAASLPLPSSLWPAYYLVRPVRLLLERLRS